MIDNRDCCDHGGNINNQEVNIDYPCEWLYNVIGSDKESVYSAVSCIIQDREYHINDSNTSKTGKYRSFDVTVMVSDEAYRNNIYQALKGHDDIKFVF